MDLYRLLGTSFNCECGQRHHVPVRRFLYERGAISKLPGILSECTDIPAIQRAIVVADNRTWQVCGQEVQKILKANISKVEQIIVPDGHNGSPVCDDATCEWLTSQICDWLPVVLIAVGSGTINDLCKWSAFKLNIPYVVLATAASMNGYAAANIAAKIEGIKVVLRGHPPVAVLAEPRVIENAPREMTAAGFGDTIAKYQSTADWQLNNLLFAEHYCPFCARMINDLEPLYLGRPENIRDARPDAVKGLFEALFWTGVVMTLIGSSAPASGAEHLFSHTLDMIADMRHEEHALHGEQVGLGTIFSAALYEKLFRIEKPTLGELPDSIDEDFWTDPAIAKAVAEQYAAKRPQLQIMRDKVAQPAIWERIEATLTATVKSPAQIKDWLTRAGPASSIGEIRCSRERAREAAVHMHEIRSRCTVVDLAWLLGVLPGATDEIMDRWLT